MFQIKPDDSYVMPAHFGPRYTGPGTSGLYRDVTTMVVSYITDAQRLARYLPPGFSVAKLPVVTVVYACNKGVDWLAGRGYNLVGVSAAVVFDGEKERIEGSYTLAMWENLTDAILSGRELQGIPKIYGDITNITEVGGQMSSSLSHFGNKIMDISVADLFSPNPDDVAAYEAENKGKDNPMAWRYMPAVGGYGKPFSEYTLFPSENDLNEVKIGAGKVSWEHLTWEQNPTKFHIVNAIADLPVLDYLPAIMTKGSTTLIVPGKPTRIIR
jgi:acetoacetate decarboxylase